MIDRDGFNGPISFCCDGCSDCEETHCTDFPSAMLKMKSHGWRVKKLGDEWIHLCPACKDKP